MHASIVNHFGLICLYKIVHDDLNKISAFFRRMNQPSCRDSFDAMASDFRNRSTSSYEQTTPKLYSSWISSFSFIATPIAILAAELGVCWWGLWSCYKSLSLVVAVTVESRFWEDPSWSDWHIRVLNENQHGSCRCSCSSRFRSLDSRA